MAEKSATGQPCSIVIPSYEDPDGVVRFLESVREQLGSKDEVLVVDDGSSDKTRQVLSARVKQLGMSNVTLLLEEHGGVSHARNNGIKQTRNSLLVFTNQDSLAAPGWLDGMKQTAQMADVVQGNYWTQVVGSHLDEQHMLWRKIVSEARNQADIKSKQKYGVVTRNLAVWKDVLLKVCGPEPFGVDPKKHGGEDRLLGMMLSQAGAVIVHNDDAKVLDAGDEHTLRALLEKKYVHGRAEAMSGVLLVGMFGYTNFVRAVILPAKSGVALWLAFLFWLAYIAGAVTGKLYLAWRRIKDSDRA